MGKKSRLKKQQRKQQHVQGQVQEQEQASSEVKVRGLEFFLLWVVRIGTGAAMFMPLVLHNKCYFPFVGPKSLYFMGWCQVVFFSWLFLAVSHKRYRPNINKVLTALVFFLIIFILSTLFGVDPSRSFWSKYERMTGLLMWFHLFGWFLAISSSFKKLSDWKGIFWVSLGVASLISFLTSLGEVGVAVWKQGGSSVGNTSFLGTYLLFNVFFALYLFFQERNKYLKGIALIAALLCGLEIYLAGARAATLGMFGGVALIGLLYFSLKPKKRAVRIISRVVLVASSLAVLTGIILLFVPGTFVSNKFIALTTASRAVNWQMAWKGFLDRPLFGWGHENYIILFPRYFNPCLFTGKCGGEIWFDRTHNIVLDTLATGGIFGFIAYFGLFGAMVYVLLKKYLKERSITFWTFSIFFSLLVGYFVQNLTVFDMPASLMLFVLTCGFIAFLAKKENSVTAELKPAKPWAGIGLAVVFLVTFFEFVIQPARADYFTIQAIITKNPTERLEYYKKTFDASSLGKYQIRDFFAQHSQEFIMQNGAKVPRQVLVTELDFVVDQLKKSRKESPLDYRAALKLAQIYNVYALLDGSKLALAEVAGNEAVALSPTNQQAYWSLVQTKVYQKDFDAALSLAQAAIDLEPGWLESYKIAMQVAQKAGWDDKVKEFARRALEVNPAWEEKMQDVLSPPAKETAP